MNRKKLALVLMSISSLSVLPSITLALDMIPSQAHYYYDMGGGSLWSTPPSSPDQSITVGSGSNTHLGYSCNAFNPSVSMANSMNDIENSVEAMSDTVLQSATTAVGSFPMYVLEKASPELYNLIQNSMTSATDTFNLSTKSCQDSLSDIRDGKSPYEDWFAVSDSQGWMNYADSAAEGQEVDVNAAQKTMVQNQSQYGVPWFHDNANSGGSIGDQVPIQALYDVSVAGYNILVDPLRQTRTLDDVSAPPSSNFLTTYWATPKDAGEWGQLVLGDITISSEKSDAANQTHAGVGLMPIMSSCPHVANYEKTCPTIIADNLWNLIKGTSSQTPDNLREVSADQLMISPQVIQALQNQTSEEQTISVNEISQEVALQNLTDEALDFRRILIAGMGTTQVQNLDPAKKQVATSIKTLEQDIDELSYDINKRKEMMSTSLVKILDHESLKAIDSQNQREEVPATTMNNGAVYTGT
ncbi:MAG: integrating conjugative element protein [Gammaproteobacteria bacterium]|nr:integrating conjugative element protein [Gammaproteobacteria bacterium]